MIFLKGVVGMRVSFLLSIFIFTLSTSLFAGHLIVPPKPDLKKTPGEICTEEDPDFETFRYEEQMAYCRRNVTAKQKKEIYDLYAIPLECRRNYTVDHFIPLAMGGNNAYKNLWPEHKKIKALRQDLEQNTYNKLLNGELKQEDAIKVIVKAKKNPPQEAYDIKDTCTK